MRLELELADPAVQAADATPASRSRWLSMVLGAVGRLWVLFKDL